MKFEEHVLYRAVDWRNGLLYVGVTLSPGRRLREHLDSGVWWGQVAAIYLERYSTRELLLVAEQEAIENEHPRYNRMGSTHERPEKAFGIVPCPVCGKDSFYRRSMDRYYHEWGEDNLECWVALSRGEVEVDTTNAFGRVLTRKVWR